MTPTSPLLIVLHLLAGGALGLASAGLATHFGYRAADRLPGESRRPECPFCLRPLGWHEFFPLFGWALRFGANPLPCPCSKRHNLWPVPVAEITGFVLGVMAIYFSSWSWSVIPLCLGLGLLPAIAIVDLVFGLIPDELNILLAFFGGAWLWASGDLFLGLVTTAGLLCFGLFLALGYSKWRGREMLGLGDVKFFAAAGLWLYPELVPWFLGSAGVFGTIMGLVWRKLGGGKEFPFAPALCLALGACVFYQVMGYTTDGSINALR